MFAPMPLAASSQLGTLASLSNERVVVQPPVDAIIERVVVQPPVNAINTRRGVRASIARQLALDKEALVAALTAKQRRTSTRSLIALFDETPIAHDPQCWQRMC